MADSLRLNTDYFTGSLGLSGVKGGLCMLLLFSGMTAVAQERRVVPNEPHQLFYLNRDPDNNTVVYQLNLEDGEVDADQPVNVYWIRYAEGGERQELTFVQRKMAYGVSHKAMPDGGFELRLAAYKDHPLWLAYSKKEKRYRVYTTITGRQAVLERIYVRIDGGSMLNPNILYIELIGYDTATKERISEQVKPDK